MAEPPLSRIRTPHFGVARPPPLTTGKVRPSDSPPLVRRLPTLRPSGRFSPRCASEARAPPRTRRLSLSGARSSGRGSAADPELTREQEELLQCSHLSA